MENFKELIPANSISVQQLATAWGRSINQIYCWINEGVDIPGGSQRVYLRAVRIGKKFAITPSQAADFIKDCNPTPEATKEIKGKTKSKLDSATTAEALAWLQS
jgi:hypothetical protein